VADRPARSILPDEAIITLAERPPRSAADIPKTRLFDPRRLSSATVEEVLAAAARGADLPPDDVRLPPAGLPARFQGVAALIAAWISQRARELSIDPALLGTRRDIEALLQNEPDLRLRLGWRAELIGADVDRIATGRAAVAYDGAGGLVLVDR
jgi:ribonuclease D